MEAVVLVDFEHLMGYLDDVVDACDPDDKHDMKSWYRSELLRDDGAIERICANLRAQAKRLPGRNTKPRKAIAAVLRYTRERKNRMRYASYYEDNLPIGSGATESTCWQMQQRVKLPGQSWDVPGLRNMTSRKLGILAHVQHQSMLAVDQQYRLGWRYLTDTEHHAAQHRPQQHAARKNHERYQPGIVQYEIHLIPFSKNCNSSHRDHRGHREKNHRQPQVTYLTMDTNLVYCFVSVPSVANRFSGLSGYIPSDPCAPEFYPSGRNW